MYAKRKDGSESKRPEFLCEFCFNSDMYCQCFPWQCHYDWETMIYDEQSGVSDTQLSVSKAPSMLMQETVHFHDQNEAWKVDASRPDFESTYHSGKEEDVSLAKFLSRPVKIFASDWATTNAAYADTFNPWDLFFSDPAVISKIKYYHNIRCRLHLKFVINGNPFLFGRVVAAYTPLHSTSNYPLLQTNLATTATRATSRPHIFIDPTSSQAGDMVLPFFWYNNYFRVPDLEWVNAGIIDMMAMTRLKHANGAVMSTRISVFAWAEDVSLTAPTNALGGLEQQSGQRDEYDMKLSTMATTASTMTSMLSSVPLIGPYARASSMILGKVGQVAKIFGYCKPVETEMKHVRPSLMGNLANVNVDDTSTKLTTDVKQEVTIDSRTVGLDGTDEMTIQSIISRSAFFYSIPWEYAATTGFKLGSFGVTPYLASRETLGPGEFLFNFLPCCHAALVFQNWRGTMKYRFQIVASNYHKGRIVVQYDPHDSNVQSFNSAYSRVVDISEERDFTIEVGWNTPSLYLEARDFELEGDAFAVGDVDIAYNDQFYNGQISLWILNELTAPTDDINTDVTINVFASCGDDFEFQNPTSEYMEKYNFHPLEFVPPGLNEQSGVSPLVADDLQDTSNPLMPISPVADSEVGKMDAGQSRMADICFGERILSFRSLIKRFALHEILGITNAQLANTDRIYKYERSGPAFPAPPGAYAAAFHNSQGGSFGYFGMPLLSWLAPAYAGRRGGIRMKFHYYPFPLPGGTNFQDLSVQHHVTRLTERNLPEFRSINHLYNAGVGSFNLNIAGYTHREFPAGQEGTTMQPVFVNPVIEAEIPWASPYRFAPSQHDSPNSKWDPGYRYSAYLLKQASTNGALVHKYVAAADDFSFFFYVGCPPAAAYTDPLPA